MVSAQYGLVHPGQVIQPYDLTVSQFCEPDRAAWALGTVMGVLDELEDNTRLREVVLELHMGADYAEPLVAVAQAVGLSWDWPVQALGIGEQRKWYRERTKSEELSARLEGRPS